MSALRLATVMDLARLVEMAREHHETAAQPWDFDAEKVELFIRSLIVEPIGFVIVLADGRDVQGMLVASVTEHPFGPVMATEWSLWIDPSHRGGMGVVRLMKAYQDEARRRGALLVEMSALPGSKFGSLLKRQGFDEREQHFVKAL